MKKKKNAVGKFIATILGNIAVIGYGLFLYQGDWWPLVIAVVATKLGIVILWRTTDD